MYADVEEMKHHRELLGQEFKEARAIERQPFEIVYSPGHGGHGRSYLSHGGYGEPRRRYTTNVWADFYRELDEGVSDIEDFILRYIRRLKAGGRDADWARRHILKKIKDYQEDTGYQYV